MMGTDGSVATGSGIPVKAVYTPEDVSSIGYERDIGLPGQPPFTRGVYANMYRGRMWTIRRYSGINTPEETNNLYRREYELGQTGFSMAFDVPTGFGLDSDDPRALADVGGDGVPVSSLEDMEITFRGLPLDRVGTALEASTMAGCPLTAMYLVIAAERGYDLKQIRGTTLNDLCASATCAGNAYQIPPHALLRLSADFIEWCCDVVPKWHPMCLDSYPYREQGINAVQELGLILATAIQYIEEGKRRGRVSLNQFVRRFAFNMGIHNDFFEEIAKLRAGRRMWYRIARERYGIDDPECWLFRLHVQSSGCTHTTQEPLNNLMRIGCQMLAACLGGAQSMHANGYDEGICLPTDQSMLLSIRTGQILQYETGVTNTADPLGGSWLVESLTNEIEHRTWEYIGQIEEMGGMAEAIRSGWVHREYRQAMLEHERGMASGQRAVVGVNRFRLEKEPYKVPIYRPNPKSPEIQVERLRRLRSERDSVKVAEALRRLEEVSRSDRNVMPAVMEAVKAYATLGEVHEVWRRVFGLWAGPMSA
ncbi:MAG: methylmalonyl-CoA mutase family protein [Chloroflexi bacterium]|nr:methylmalonyl-CoA mutase family protein [Chloroflexota bacterium]